MEKDAEIVDNSRRNKAGTRSGVLRTDSEMPASVSSKTRWSAFDAHPNTLCSILSSLNWCIGYLHGSGKKGIARAIAKSREYIRTNLLKRSEQPR